MMPIRMAGDRLQNPAFLQQDDGTWGQSENTGRIMDELEQYNPEIKLRPINSVEAFGDGTPMWGSGAGYYDMTNPNVINVDPIKGDTHVVAHEGGHAVAASSLRSSQGGGRFGNYGKLKDWYSENNPHHPSNAPNRTGASVRANYEYNVKPTMIEEAQAQGFGIGLQQKLGIPYTNDMYDHPYDYPAQPARQYPKMYEMGAKLPKGESLNPSEAAEIQVLKESMIPAIERQYKLGYERAMQGPR